MPRLVKDWRTACAFSADRTAVRDLDHGGVVLRTKESVVVVYPDGRVRPAEANEFIGYVDWRPHVAAKLKTVLLEISSKPEPRRVDAETTSPSLQRLAEYLLCGKEKL